MWFDNGMHWVIVIKRILKKKSVGGKCFQKHLLVGKKPLSVPSRLNFSAAPEVASSSFKNDDLACWHCTSIISFFNAFPLQQNPCQLCRYLKLCERTFTEFCCCPQTRVSVLCFFLPPCQLTGKLLTIYSYSLRSLWSCMAGFCCSYPPALSNDLEGA